MELQYPEGTGAQELELVRRRNRRGLAHAYMICGQAGARQKALAQLLAACYVCTGERSQAPCGRCAGCRKATLEIHPDIMVVGEDGKDIAVAAVRALRADAYIRPNEAPRKVFILHRAEHMNPSAQNALLKLLEEGPAYAAFLLLVENELALLPTVRSRCQTIRLSNQKQLVEEPDDLAAQAAILADLMASGQERALLEFGVALEKWDREQLAGLLDRTVDCLRDRLSVGGQLAQRRKLFHQIDHIRTLRSACDFNVGAGHLAGWLTAGSFLE